MSNCLITGGTRGIGYATALVVAAAGYDVTAVGRTHDGLRSEDLITQIEALGQRCVVLQGDVAHAADVERIFQESEAAFGTITALVNSAGISGKSRVDALLADQVDRILSVNVFGLMLCCREAARRMSTVHGGRGGAIVNVSSMAATIGGRPGSSVYAASKAAVDAFTSGFAREVAAEGIRVNVVRPGVIETEMIAERAREPAARERNTASIPMQRLGRPEEVAEAIGWLLSDKASLVTGAHLNISGGGFMVAGWN